RPDPNVFPPTRAPSLHRSGPRPRTRSPPAHEAPPSGQPRAAAAAPAAPRRRDGGSDTSAALCPVESGTDSPPPTVPASPARPAPASPPRRVVHTTAPGSPSDAETSGPSPIVAGGLPRPGSRPGSG